MAPLLPARSKAQAKQQITATLTRLAPVGGWNTRDPLAGMNPKYARVMENCFPTASGVSLRRGCTDHVVSVPGVVKTVMAFEGASTRKLFGASDTKIFDATSSGTNPAQLVARTKGEHIWTNFTGTGGSFLFAVNGQDDLAMYTGSTDTWSTVASFPISGGGTLNTNTIAYVAVFKRMLFFVTNNSTDFYFLPIDQIAGTVSRFPLGGQMNRGGYVNAIGTWSVNDQADGSNDFCVFITSRGQAIVYGGTDPAVAANWGLKGKYDLGLPLGRNCLKKQRGDLYILCTNGLFSMNTAFASTTSSLLQGFTDNISPTMREFAALTGSTYGWQIEILESARLLLINVPQQQLNTFNQFVMNLDTGSWCRFTGWNAYSFTVLNDTLYFSMAGKVVKAWQPGGDFGQSITAVVAGAFDYLSPRATQKHVNLVRPVYSLSGSGTISFGLDVDFRNSMLYEGISAATGANSLYDTAQWDVSTFSGLPTASLDWLTLTAQEGFCFAFRLRLIAQDATFDWSSLDYAYEAGSPVG